MKKEVNVALSFLAVLTAIVLTVAFDMKKETSDKEDVKKEVTLSEYDAEHYRRINGFMK